MQANSEEFPADCLWEEESTAQSAPMSDIPKASHGMLQTRRHSAPEPLNPGMEFCTTLPKSLASEELKMSPLYDAFISLYLPKSDLQKSYLCMIRSVITASASNSALAKALKAVSLLVISRDSKTSHFFHAATEMYSDALSTTRCQLANLNTDKIGMIRIAHMLSICELFFSPILDDSAARPHTRWALSLIESFGRRPDFPKTHPLLASSVRLFATWECLIARRLPCGVVTPADETIVRPADSWATLSDFSIHTAKLVESSDNICAQDAELESFEVFRVLEKLVQLESKIHSWMAYYYENTPGSLYRFTASPYPRFPRTAPLFPVAYDFPIMGSSLLHIGYWMCMLALVEAKMDIQRKYQHILDVNPTNLVYLEKLIHEYADNICMSMPFMSKSQCGWSGRIFAIRPLRFLVLHYKKRSNWPKLMWCMEFSADLGVQEA